VAEVVATENSEINLFGSKEEPRSSGQATALFLFEHSDFFYLRLYELFLGVQILIAHSSGSMKYEELTRRSSKKDSILK
jgi:hypothetical protein